MDIFVSIALVMALMIVILVTFKLYLDEREHKKTMRRLARQSNRAIRDYCDAIEDICLESMRRDGYLIRRNRR